MAFYIFLFLLLLFIFARKMKGDREGGKLPPGPPKLPIIGNLHQLSNMPHRSFWQLAKQYGPLMHLQLGFAPTLIVSSARMAEEILRIHDLEFCSRPSLIGPKKLSYNFKDIAFTPYTEYWRDLRKTCVVELFSSQRVHMFRFIREDEVSTMIHSISSSSSSPSPVNLSEVMLSLVNNIICRMAFGQRHQEVCQRSRFQDILQEAQAMLGGFYFEDYFPSIGWLIDVLSGQHAKLEKNFRELDEFFEQVISHHLNPDRPEPDHEDIVDVLLRIEKEQCGAIHFSKDHIKAVIMDIFVAGTDTVTAALVWGMAELIKNPKVMKKAQDEVRSAVGKKGKVEESDLDQLEYVMSVVKEILRTHPPGPLLAPRETRFHCKIDGYDVYKKTRVIVSPWAIGRDPEAWENPDEFFPERFIGSPIDFKGLHFQLVPLGAGRRGCPGLYLGPAIVQLALANLLYAFNWELPSGIRKEDIDMEEAPGLTTHKKTSLCLVPKSYI